MRKPGKGRAGFHYVLKEVRSIKVSEQKNRRKKKKTDEEKVSYFENGY